MRDLILKMSMSIDGFVSDLDGGNKWMFGTDQEAKAWSVEYLWNAGLRIMGSRSFHDMAAWWPTSTDQFAPPMNRIDVRFCLMTDSRDIYPDAAVRRYELRRFARNDECASSPVTLTQPRASRAARMPTHILPLSES